MQLIFFTLESTVVEKLFEERKKKKQTQCKSLPPLTPTDPKHLQSLSEIEVHQHKFRGKGFPYLCFSKNS